MRFEGQDRSVFLETGLEIDERRVPLAVGKEHLFLTNHNPDGFAGLAGEQGSGKVHIKHFVFAAETPSNIRLNHTDPA